MIAPQFADNGTEQPWQPLPQSFWDELEATRVSLDALTTITTQARYEAMAVTAGLIGMQEKN